MPKMVRDYMHRGLLTCRPGTKIGQVAVLLTQHHVHGLIVTDRDGRALGVITDFDLMAGEWLSGDPQSLEVMRKMTAGELMSTPVDSIDINASAPEAAAIMRSKLIRRVVVTENDKPVGVISVSDIIESIADTIPAKRDSVKDVMSDAMLVCRDKTPIVAAAKAMTSAGWRSVLVVDKSGRPLGVVSGLDMLAACENDNCDEITVTDVMHPALTITMDATLQEAASKMIENHHHRLVVIDPEEPDSMPLGIISSFDIVGEMARPDSVWQQ